MFRHNFKYSLKVLLKDRGLIFWTIAWPLILGTLFYLAFSNVSNSEKLSTINLGVVNNSSYINDTTLATTLKNLSGKDNKDYLFNIKYGSLKNEKKLLDESKIDGYIYNDNGKISIVVKDNGINQTIIKYVVDEIKEYEKLATDIVAYNINKYSNNNLDINVLYSNVVSKFYTNKEYINAISNKNMDYVMIEYYTLIAMTCLFGAMLTCTVIGNYLSNINKKGARITIAPINRLTLLLSGFAASLVVQLVTTGLLLVYTKVFLHVDYGSHFNLVILLALVGSLAGSSLGLAVGSMTFKNDNLRIGTISLVTMLGCFFSGMMGITLKYVIDTKMPFINIINPANMITDGFYALYYYNTLSRFYSDIISLIVLTIILFIISCFLMRRKKYDSI